jgi:hypothetical protein
MGSKESIDGFALEALDKIQHDGGIAVNRVNLNNRCFERLFALNSFEMELDAMSSQFMWTQNTC